MPSVKVIFHIDEYEKWSLVLANIRNLINVVDISTSEIEVLVNSKAVCVFDAITLPIQTEAITELANLGIQITVCQNSLNGLKIPAERLPECFKIVPVGVLELIEKQRIGFAYIKP